MLKGIIRWSVQNRFLVLVASLLITAWGQDLIPYRGALTLGSADRFVALDQTTVDDDGIAAILESADDPATAVWDLIEAANGAGGVDNTTVAVVDVSP